VFPATSNESRQNPEGSVDVTEINSSSYGPPKPGPCQPENGSRFHDPLVRCSDCSPPGPVPPARRVAAQHNAGVECFRPQQFKIGIDPLLSEN